MSLMRKGGMPNDMVSGVMVPFNVVLTIYQHDDFLGRSYVIDGTNSIQGISGEMKCIYLGYVFDKITSSFTVEHKKFGYQSGYWKNVGSATGSLSYETINNTTL